MRSTWDVEVQTFGPGDNDGLQVRILNRILAWGTSGTEHEADQTHAAVRKNLRSKDRPASTPGDYEMT